MGNFATDTQIHVNTLANNKTKAYMKKLFLTIAIVGISATMLSEKKKDKKAESKEEGYLFTTVKANPIT